MPRAYTLESPMIETKFRSNLDCQQCGAHIIRDGKLTCPRCHESVQMHSMQACPEGTRGDVICDKEGRWKCQKCPEHGKNPKTLAIGDQIQCRKCGFKNDLFEKEPKVAKKKTASEKKVTITSECRDALWLLGNLNLPQVMDNPLCEYVWKAIHHVEKCKKPVCISAQTAVDTLVAILMWCDSTQEAENQRFVEEVLPRLFKKDKSSTQTR